MLKKLALAVIFITVTATLIAGCTSSTTSTKSGSNVGTMNLEVVRVPAPATIGSPYVYEPKAGFTFIMFNTTVTNVDATSRNVDPLYFTLNDSDGNAYSRSLATDDKSIAGFPNNVVTNPGDKVNGLLVFEVPKNAQLTTLVYNDDVSRPVTVPVNFKAQTQGDM